MRSSRGFSEEPVRRNDPGTRGTPYRESYPPYPPRQERTREVRMTEYTRHTRHEEYRGDQVRRTFGRRSYAEETEARGMRPRHEGRTFSRGRYPYDDFGTRKRSPDASRRSRSTKRTRRHDGTEEWYRRDEQDSMGGRQEAKR